MPKGNTPDAPAGTTTSPGGAILPEGKIHVDNQVQFAGQNYNRSESGLFLPEDNLHAPNESFKLSLLHKGIETVQRTLRAVARG